MFAVNVDMIGRITEPFYIEASLSLVDEHGVNLGPIDFTGSDIRMHVREYPDASQIVLELTTENGWLIPMTPTPPGNANLAMSVPKIALVGVTVRSYAYDLRYWDGPVLLYGELTFIQGVTR